jgi:hypothetical protein
MQTLKGSLMTMTLQEFKALYGDDVKIEHITPTNGRTPADVFPLEETADTIARFIVGLPKTKQDIAFYRCMDVIRDKLTAEGFPLRHVEVWHGLVSDDTVDRWIELDPT